MNKFLHCNIINLSLIFLVGLCSAYITSVTSFSPYYLGLLVSLCFSFIVFINRLTVLNDDVCKSLGNVIVLMSIFYVVNVCYTKTFDKAFGLSFVLLINQLSTLLVYSFCKLSKNNQLYFIKKTVRFYFIVEVIIGIVDLIYRFHIRNHCFSGMQYFYNFKGSIMFDDSNWNGFIYMISYAFFLYLYDNYRIVSKKQLQILFLFCVCSLSRAALFCTILVIMYSRFLKLSKRKKSLYIILLSTFGSVAAPFFIWYVTHDDSFNTKLIILKGLSYFLTHNQIEKLLIGFGFGFAAGDLADMYLNYSGVHGHLYIVIKLMDFGILGLFLELIYFFTIMRLTNFKFLYLFIPFFICGLSMAPGNLSFLYCFSGVVIFLEQNRNKILGVSYARRINQCNNANLQC